MALPEYIYPVLAIGGPVALVLILLRFGPDAYSRLLAGTVAVLTRDEKRGRRCLEVLRILRGRDQPPPLPPSDSWRADRPRIRAEGAEAQEAPRASDAEGLSARDRRR
jgi:hypothetical protein